MRFKKETIIMVPSLRSQKTYALRLRTGSEKVIIKGNLDKSISYSAIEQGFYNRGGIFHRTRTTSKNNFKLKTENTENVLNVNSYNKGVFSKDLKTSPVI